MADQNAPQTKPTRWFVVEIPVDANDEGLADVLLEAAEEWQAKSHPDRDWNAECFVMYLDEGTEFAVEVDVHGGRQIHAQNDECRRQIRARDNDRRGIQMYYTISRNLNPVVLYRSAWYGVWQREKPPAK